MDNLILPPRVELDIKKAAAEKQKQLQDKSRGRGVVSPWQQRGVSNGAVKKNGDWATQYEMYRRHAIVRAAIDKIAKSATIAGIEITPRNKRDEENEKEVSALKEFFNDQPNIMSVLRQVIRDLLICGDAYIYVIPDMRRRPARFKRLHPDTIEIKAKPNGEVLAYLQAVDRLSQFNEDYRVFKPEEILHFKIDDPDNDLYGLSPLESLGWAVAADIYAQRYNAAFFQNSGVTGTIIAVKNANPEEVERNRKWFTENYTGPESAHLPVVVEGEEVSIHKAVATHSEMGFLEGRKFVIMEILAVLDVPPAKVGMMEDANRSNSKEQDKTFRSESLSPLQSLITEVINDEFIKDILGCKETIIGFAIDDNRDMLEQIDYFEQAIKSGILNVNEARARLGYADVEGGSINAIMTPTGFVPLDRLNLYFQMPEQNADKVPPVPEDPVEGEPTPKDKAPAQESIGKQRDLYGLQQGLFALSKHEADTLELRKALAFLTDASEGIVDDTDLILRARNSLYKSMKSDDDLMKFVYLEQARGYASDILSLVNSTQERNTYGT